MIRSLKAETVFLMKIVNLKDGNLNAQQKLRTHLSDRGRAV